MTTVHVAIAQAAPAADLESGLRKADALAKEAALAGAQLVVFPETWLPGYPAWLDHCRDAALWDHAPVKAVYARLAEESVTVPGPATEALGSIAAESSVTLVVGASERVERGRGRGTLYNALLTFGPDGALLNHHRKLTPAYTEHLVFGGGDASGLRAVDTPAGRIGGLICWEHWSPLSRQALHESGEDVHVAAWPTVKPMSLMASRHYAFEGRCWVLAAGSVQRAAALPAGLEPHPHRVPDAAYAVVAGGSCIIAPDGDVVAGPAGEESAILVADVDPGRVREEHMTLDVAGHYARPDCFRLQRMEAGALRPAGAGIG